MVASDVRLEEKDIVLNGCKYHYIEIPNTGRPKVLMVHGIMVESHCFLGIISFLKDYFHIYSIDLKGHGRSDNGNTYYDSYTPNAISNDFYEFYKSVIKEKFSYIGYSLGGQFGIAYAARYSDTLNKLIIIDSAPSISTKGLFTIMMANVVKPKFFKNRDSIIRFYNKAKIDGLSDYMANYCMVETEKGYRLRFDKNIAPPTVLGMIRRDRELWLDFAKISIPLLLVKAKDSEIINNRIVTLIKQVNRNIRIVEIEGKHTFVFSNPKPIADVIRDFLGYWINLLN